jgi:hypothetical protein
MAWVNPSNVSTGDVLTATKWNQEVAENTSVLPRVISSGAVTTSAISIPSAADYALLRISLVWRSSRAAAVNDQPALRLNGDSGSNYDALYAWVNNAADNRAEQRAQSSAVLGFMNAVNATTSFFATHEITIPDPGGTTAFKTGTHTNGWGQTTSTNEMFAGHGWFQWRNTAAITSITFLTLNSASFITGSTYAITGYPFA